MKRKILVWAALILCLCLASGCGKVTEETAPPPETLEQTLPTISATAAPATEEPTEEPTQEPTDEPTEEPTEPETQAPTEPSTEPSAEPTFQPYLQKISRPDQSIYSGPGYDYGYVGTVELAGTYTIMEEVTDPEGNLWGRLKSGIGWVDLTDVRRSNANPPLLSVNYADDTLMRGEHHYYQGDTSIYAVSAAFRAGDSLENFTIYRPSKNPDGTDCLEKLYSLSCLDPEKPLVADLAFPGDMSSYVIEFLHPETGKQHRYTLYMSGRDGSLQLTEE